MIIVLLLKLLLMMVMQVVQRKGSRAGCRLDASVIARYHRFTTDADPGAFHLGLQFDASRGRHEQRRRDGRRSRCQAQNDGRRIGRLSLSSSSRVGSVHEGSDADQRTSDAETRENHWKIGSRLFGLSFARWKSGG